jgi:hypothetical protein
LLSTPKITSRFSYNRNARPTPFSTSVERRPERIAALNVTKSRSAWSAAFEKVLDNPAAQKALQDPALKPLLEEASS